MALGYDGRTQKLTVHTLANNEKRFLKILSLIWNSKIDQVHALLSVYASFQVFKYWSDGPTAATSALKLQFPSVVIH